MQTRSSIAWPTVAQGYLDSVQICVLSGRRLQAGRLAARPPASACCLREISVSEFHLFSAFPFFLSSERSKPLTAPAGWGLRPTGGPPSSVCSLSVWRKCFESLVPVPLLSCQLLR